MPGRDALQVARGPRSRAVADRPRGARLTASHNYRLKTLDREARRADGGQNLPRGTELLVEYNLSFRNGRACVRIEAGEYKRLKAYFLELACHRSVEAPAAEFARLGFQPYAPIRVQFLNIWRAVNRARLAAGYERVPIECVPWRRRIVRAFGEAPNLMPAQACV